MENIICLYWVGEFRGRNFKASDVWRLYNNCKHFVDQGDPDFNFYTLTNDMKADLPGTKIELKHNFPGWWSKIELHRSDLPQGRTLYIDLDTTIVRSLKQVWKTKGNLVMGQNKMRKKNNDEEGRKIVNNYQAGIMLFDPGSTYESVYKRFIYDPEHWMANYRSEQDLMGLWIPDQPKFPDQWLCKLGQITGDRKPHPKTIFVTGQPKKYNYRDYGKN